MLCRKIPLRLWFVRWLASPIINVPLSAPDSDSEEHSSARGGWPPLSGTRSHCTLTRKRRCATSPTSLLSGQKSQKKKHKHLSLLLEEAGLSSSDDSFDQGYWANLTAPPPSTHKRVPKPRHSSCPCLHLDTEATFRLLFSATHHYLSRCWLLCKVAFFLNELTNFYGVFF